MHLFLNTVSSSAFVCLFNDKRDILCSLNFYISGSESSQLMGRVANFLSENYCAYADIQNIVAIVGPGSFTGIRTSVLYINTLAYVFPHIFLTPLSFFDLYDRFPMIKTSSKKDLFVQNDKSAIIQIILLDEFSDYLTQNKILDIYGDTPELFSNCTIHSEIHYQKIIEKISFQTHKTLTPFYMKKPNIT